MEWLTSLIDLILKFDDHLQMFIAEYGTWTYLILFAIIFCETGLVVTPILPGDSLLFAAGAFSALGLLDLGLLFLLLTIAAVLGDAVNYSIGHFLGPKVLTRDGRFLKKAYLDRAQQFYVKYGGKTIILARFVPIVRTFAPFLAGVGSMSYPRFAIFNVTGALLWVSVCMFAGYFFGNIPIVKEHFEMVILGIIFVSVLPALFEAWRSRREKIAPVVKPVEQPIVDP